MGWYIRNLYPTTRVQVLDSPHRRLEILERSGEDHGDHQGSKDTIRARDDIHEVCFVLGCLICSVVLTSFAVES